MANITASDILAIDENAEVLLEVGEHDSRLQWVTMVNSDGDRLFAVTTNGDSIFDCDDNYGAAMENFDADFVREVLTSYAVQY